MQLYDLEHFGSIGECGFYSISLVLHFNVPMVVVPMGVPGNNCDSTRCPNDLTALCLAQLKVTKKGQVEACLRTYVSLNVEFLVALAIIQVQTHASLVCTPQYLRELAPRPIVTLMMILR
ncbi:Glucan endo-1,3-beta-glucosidase [Spatholobus suberectus]|nr:Glucan endo-1,3-beta-glucosidase [Spatholobus suberectus]